MESEDVSFYWSFATGKMVQYANMRLDQIVSTNKVLYVLTPDQNLECGMWALSHSF